MLLHQLLSLERPLIVVDTETTGIDTQKDRIVELGFQVWTANGMESEWRSLINPGISIPKEVSEKHHIVDEDMKGCRRCGIPRERHPVDDGVIMEEAVCINFAPIPFFKQVAPRIASGFSNCDFAGKNVRFDLRILSAEMARADIEWSTFGARIVDIDRLEQIAVPRSLSDLYEKYTGEKLVGAHTALIDVRASVTVLYHQFRQHQQLPRTLNALHDLQFPGMIDLDGKFRFVNGVPCFTQWGKHANKPMREVPTGYYDFIIDGGFSGEVKAIARAAKLGRFPGAEGR
jgi:DNA polymerase-3 subunit epsilon